MKAGRMIVLSLGILAAHVHCEEGDEADSSIEGETLTAEQLRRLHEKFDGNSDGKVSLQEVLAFSRETGRSIASKDIPDIVQEIDTSKDGKLTLEEHLADIHTQADGASPEEQKELEERKAVETAKFKAADKDGDGVCDHSEMLGLFYPEHHDDVLQVTVRETMRQKDKDNDGTLTKHEFWEAHPEGGEQAELSEEEHEDFKKLDLNGDGVIDMAEMSSWESGHFHTDETLKKLFDMADKDRDMHLTAEELMAAREQIMESEAQYHLARWAEHHEV